MFMWVSSAFFTNNKIAFLKEGTFLIYLFLIANNTLFAGRLSLRRICAGSDKSITISWLPFIDTCDGVKQINIYIKKTPNPSDKFIPFATIKTLNTDEYLIKSGVPDLILSSFYIEYIISCGGGIVSVKSDIQEVDLVKPKPIQPDSVSVVGKNIQIGWSKEGSLDINGYVVYKETGSFTQAIDTVYGANNTYYLTKLSLYPTDSTYKFRLAALDSCKNVGPAISYHETMRLYAQVDSCKQRIKLFWTPYIGWKNGVLNYVVFLRTDSGNYQQVASVSGALTNYSFSSVMFKKAISFYIRAVSSNNYTSSSNVLNLIPRFSGTLDTIKIKSTYFKDNKYFVILDRPNFNYQYIECLSGNIRTNLQFDQKIEAFKYTCSEDGVSKYYQVISRDVCGNICGQSPIIEPIRIKVTKEEGNQNRIDWSKIHYASNNGLKYEIYKGISQDNENIFELLFTTDSLQTTYIDKYDDATEMSNYGLCYQIRTSQAIKETDSISTSAVVCAIDSPLIYFPTGYIWNGVSGPYKPQYTYADSVKSRYRIYNYWGQQVFSGFIYESFVDIGNRKNFPEGIFFYICDLEGLNHKRYQLSGSFVIMK